MEWGVAVVKTNKKRKCGSGENHRLCKQIMVMLTPLCNLLYSALVKIDHSQHFYALTYMPLEEPCMLKKLYF